MKTPATIIEKIINRELKRRNPPKPEVYQEKRKADLWSVYDREGYRGLLDYNNSLWMRS